MVRLIGLVLSAVLLTSCTDYEPAALHVIRTIDTTGVPKVVTVSPSGSLIAVVTMHAKSGQQSQTASLTVYRLTDGNLLYQQDNDGIVVIDWAADDSLAVADGENVEIIDSNGSVVKQLDYPSGARWVGLDALQLEPILGDRSLYVVDINGTELVTPSDEDIALVSGFSNDAYMIVSRFGTSGGQLSLYSVAGQEIWHKPMSQKGAPGWVALDHSNNVYVYTQGEIRKYTLDGQLQWQHPIQAPRTTFGDAGLWIVGDYVWANQQDLASEALGIGPTGDVKKVPLPKGTQLIGVSESGELLLAGAGNQRVESCLLVNTAGESVHTFDDTRLSGCAVGAGGKVVYAWHDKTITVYSLAGREGHK